MSSWGLDLRRVRASPRSRSSALFGALWAGLVCAQGLILNEAVFDWMSDRYGVAARDRALALRDLIGSASGISETDKLERVNAFFNAIDYVSDYEQWGQQDYWATPFEVLGENAADCEDYAISKYFTLLSMGVEDSRLRITYVKALTLNEAHMVLAYYPKSDAEPLILDNLKDDILPAAQRSDLVPVYSFNGSDLWLAANRLDDKKVGSADRLSLWQEYQARLRAQMAKGR